jgi:hypothetical protein
MPGRVETVMATDAVDLWHFARPRLGLRHTSWGDGTGYGSENGDGTGYGPSKLWGDGTYLGTGWGDGNGGGHGYSDQRGDGDGGGK